MLDEYSSFRERTSEKSGKFSIGVKRKHKRWTEIHKTLNNFNQIFELCFDYVSDLQESNINWI